MHEPSSRAGSRTAMLAGYRLMDTEPEQQYDDLIHLVADICEVPVVLIGLVDDEREWFKARIGLDRSEVDRACSISAHGVADEAMLVIPDLRRDSRTAENPLVTGPPRYRFYAGAPIVTTSGDNLGMVGIVDFYPRPTGLTERQRRSLATVGRQVTMNIEMHRLLCEFSLPPGG